MKSYTDIDSYIEASPEAVREKLGQMRATIQKAAPKATEAISYGIPTFKLYGNLVHFGGFKDHVGFFPAASGVAAFKKELSSYEVSKGTVRFPLDKPLPLGLIKKIVAFRVKENEAKSWRVCSRGHKFQGSAPCPVCWPGRLKKANAKKPVLKRLAA